MKLSLLLTCAFICLLLAPASRAAEEPADAQALRNEIDALRQQLEAQKRDYDARLQLLRQALDKLAAQQPVRHQLPEEAPAEPDLEALLQQLQQPPEEHRPGIDWGRAFQSFNPDISVIIDTFYHHDDSEEGISHVLGGIDGFGHSHGHEGHHHAETENGFNLRHLELYLGAEVDPYFKAWAIPAISEEGAELEEAVIQTTGLPYGLQVKAGKFFSEFCRVNAQHSHEWDFVDAPLINQLVFGDHGLNDKGVQLSWLAPTDVPLTLALEAFQGDNETMFSHVGGDELPDRSGPRVLVQWLKLAPEIGGNHGIQFGGFHGSGVHQEAHDGDGDGVEDHWLDGTSLFWGGDVVYKYDSPAAHEQGDVVLQGEYLSRRRDLNVENHALAPAVIGNNRVDQQDGIYLQGTYGFLPRWRAGARWDLAGITNKQKLPDGTAESFDDSNRYTGMIDWTLTEFSRLRFQVSQGRYAAEGEKDKVTQFFLQLMVSLGSHGAHKF